MDKALLVPITVNNGFEHKSLHTYSSSSEEELLIEKLFLNKKFGTENIPFLDFCDFSMCYFPSKDISTL